MAVQQQQPDNAGEVDAGEALLDAFLGEEAAGAEDRKQFDRPTGDEPPEGEAAEAEAEGEGEAEEITDPDEAEEAEAEAAEGAAQGDQVELPDGTKIAVEELIAAHQFKAQTENQLQQLRHHVVAQAQQEIEGTKQAWLGRTAEIEQVYEFLQSLVPNYERPPTSMLVQGSPDYDPDGYHFLNAKINEIEGRKGEAARRIQEARKVREQEAAENLRRSAEQSLAMLVAERPEWGDPAKFVPKRDALISSLKQNYKFDDAILNTVYDYRFYLMAEDAAAYRALKSKAAPKPAGANAPKAPRLIRTAANPGPKAAQSRRVAEAEKTLKRTGKVTDREAIFGKFVS